MKKFSALVLGGSTYLLPVLTFAQTSGDPNLTNIGKLLKAIGGLISTATPIIVGLALLAFFWGLVKFIFAASDDDKKSGKSFMIGGIIAIFVMVSVVGIVTFIGNAFGVDQGGDLPVPGVETGTRN